LRHVVISVPPVGRTRFQLDENRAAPSGFASETNNKCQIKSKLLHMMRTFDRVHERRTKVAPPTNVQHRLPIGQSAAVIAGLSALSWAVVISLIVALRAIV
jgi:hypothetical protein